MWTCSTPPPIDRTPKSLYKLHESCSLESMVDAQYFALNTGDSIRAAQIYFWLSSHSHPKSSSLSQLALGKRILPYDSPLASITLKKKSPVDLSSLSIIPEQIKENGVWGKYPYWHLPIENHNLISISPTAHMESLRYAMASRKTKEEPLKVLVLSDDLTSISIHPPTSSHPEIIERDEHGWRAKTELEYVRVNFPNDEPVQSLITFIEEHQNKTVELSMNSTPCSKGIYKDMTCHPAKQKLETLYVDTTPSKEYATCAAAGICRAHQGTWFSAVQLCRFQGKRLPTKSESIYFTDEQWTADIGLSHHHRWTTNNRSLSVETVLQHSTRCVASFHPNRISNQTLELLPVDEDTQKRVHQRIQEERASFAPHPSTLWNNLIETNHSPQKEMFFENLGGVYLGYGDGTNLYHIALSKPQWAIIWSEHREDLYRMIMMSILIHQSEDTQHVREILKNPSIVQEKIKEREKSKKQTPLLDLWKKEKDLFIHSMQILLNDPNNNSWLSNETSFQYLKQIITENRLFIISGTWEGKKTLSSVGEAFHDIGVPIRMLYLGTILDGWKTPMKNRKKRNLESLPFDNQSRVFHTQLSDMYVIDGLTFQKRLSKDTTGIWFDTIPSGTPNIHITGVLTP